MQRKVSTCQSQTHSQDKCDREQAGVNPQEVRVGKKSHQSSPILDWISKGKVLASVTWSGHSSTISSIAHQRPIVHPGVLSNHGWIVVRSEEHTSELQSRQYL